MRLIRYRGRHLRRRVRYRGPVAVGTAASFWVAGSGAHAAVHEVAPGETLSGIAARYGTSVADLAAANDLADPNLIIAGQRLRVPDRVTMTSTHTVRSGETLSAIAARFGTSVRALARANHIADVSLIIAGTSLRVPSTGASVAAAPASGPSIERSLEYHARAQGVDASLVKAVAWQESGWQQDARSSAGAIGVMQVMPETAHFVNEVLGGGELEVRRAEDNVQLGILYLKHMLAVTSSPKRALAAYFSGPGAVRGRLNKAQRRYANNVQALQRRFT